MADVDLNKLRVQRDASPALAPRRRSRSRWWWIALLLAGAGAGAYWLNPPAIPVDTTQVVLAYPSQQYVELNATGYVVARRRAAVASKATGRVEWLGVTEGSKVRAGEIIARLESRDVDAKLANAVANTGVARAGVTSARADLANAEQSWRRSQELNARNFISQTALDDARARFDRARAAVASAEANLAAAQASESYARNEVDSTRIVAPFDGVVIARSANVGDVVTPLSSAADAKGAVAVVADMSTLEIDADVSESALGKVRLGQPCEIVFDAFPDKRYRGEVSTIVPTVNRASATVTTKVRIVDPDASILPDMSAKVRFLSRAIDAAADTPRLAADPKAIVSRDNRTLVFRVDADGVARAVPVAPGAMLGELRALETAAAVPAADAGGIKLAASRVLEKAGAAVIPVARADGGVALKSSAALAPAAAELKAGDLLVLNPPERVQDGSRVKTRN